MPAWLQQVALVWWWATSTLAALVVGLLWGWHRGSEYWRVRCRDARAVAQLAVEESVRAHARAGMPLP